jgi:hypothetical protein
LFSVNTAAGLPIIEAFSDNTVRIGQFGQRALFVSQSRVGIGKETGLNDLLDVSGSAIITGSLTVITGSNIEFQVLNTGVRIGNVVTDTHTVTGSFNISGSITSNGNTTVTGSFIVITGSSREFQVTNIGVNIGNVVTDTHTVTGSFNISGSITGSLLGTASFATSASWAPGGGGGTVTGQIILTAGGGWPSITSGSNPPIIAETPTNRVNFYYIGFPDGSQTFANWAMPMPSDYNGGTITAVFYWAAGSASTNSVRWGLAARAYADSQLLDQAFGTAQEVTDANQANDDVNISAATPAITIGGTPAGGNFVQFRAFRNPADAADNLAATAELLSIRITYTRA